MMLNEIKYIVMKKIFTLVVACLMGISSLSAQSPVKKQVEFAKDQEAQIEILSKGYEKLGFDIKQARMKAEMEVAPETVRLRVGSNGSGTPSSSRPGLSPWPTNHAAWAASPTHPGSIDVDRDVVIHGYTPAELVRKILLKSYSAEDEARIQNVTFLGFNGVAGGGNAWADNPSLSAYGQGNRGMAYFTKGTSSFDIEKGLLLSTGHTWGHEGPNESTTAFNEGVNETGWNVGYGSGFDPDLTTIAGQTTSVGGILEFDFCPAIEEAKFDYVFGSEEYPEYVHSSFNDVFGFFISGPYEAPGGSVTTALPAVNAKGSATYDGKNISTYNRFNIAQLPNGMPVGVDWTNWGYRSSNTSASWATLAGANTTAPWDSVGAGAAAAANGTWGNLHATSGNTRFLAFNPQYYRANMVGDDLMELDGITVKLTALMDGLVPGKWYRLKIAISQVDVNHGDGVFLGNLDLGSAGIGFTSPYLSGSRANSQFHNISSTYQTLDDQTKGYVQGLIAGAPGLSLKDTAKYKGFIYSDCQYSINEEQLTFAGPGNVILHLCGDDSFGDYFQLDNLFIGSKKIEYCYEGGTGEKKSILDYAWGKDTIHRDASDTKGTLYFTMKQLPEELNGKISGIANLIYTNPIGVGDTVLFAGFSKVETDIKYYPVTEIHSGSLTLGLKGGSNYIRWSTVYGIDCDAEYDNDCRWRYLRNTATGEELPFSEWELLSLYAINDRVPLVIQEPGSCWVDTLWIGGGGIKVIQRAIEIPEVEGVTTDPKPGVYYAPSNTNYSFTARYSGELMNVLAEGFYSKSIIDLAAEKQEDGSYKYTLYKVTEPWTISFAPNVNSGDVSNNIFTDQPVWSSGNILHINTQDSEIVNVYTLVGILYKQVSVNGYSTIQLPKGFYVVSVNGKQYKVVIK